MSTTRTPTPSADRWTPTEIATLLQALEPLADPGTPGCTVSVRDRRFEVSLEPAAGPPAHHALLHAGRLTGAVENALRSLGWAPRAVIAATAGEGPLVSITATRRRPASPTDLARRRVARGAGEAARPQYTGTADMATVVDVVHAAGSRGGWLHLLNGPTRNGIPAWHTPGEIPVDTLGLDVPWRRHPVLAVCTHEDGTRESVVAGIVVERATVEAALHGLRAEVHAAAFDDRSVRAAALRAAEHEHGVGHAAIRLRP
ncbi:hypothetical protein PHK61_13965 [Actinomycetospora lutea]|uniref:hypothetical protein n=1 Tax=Actinomycetospora lutea TaxID=663604 RepID=UPI00236675DC|nr:hypothetical protein [Actinomycetospora lutea]MDD7939525.1 hypothetical protein [Actinomycetospora lutea]